MLVVGSPLPRPNGRSALTGVIDQILAYHEGKPGISKRGLEEKFAEGKKSLGQ